MDRALSLFLLLLFFKSAFINGWEESCADPASASNPPCVKLSFIHFLKPLNL